MNREYINQLIAGLALVVVSLCFLLGREQLIQVVIRFRSWQFNNPQSVTKVGYVISVIVFAIGIYLSRKNLKEGFIVIGAAALLAVCSRFAVRYLLPIMRNMDQSYSYIVSSNIAVITAGVISGLIGLRLLLPLIARIR